MSTIAPAMKFTDEQEDLLNNISENYESSFAEYFTDEEGSTKEQELLDALDDIGITSWDEFEDRYYGQCDTYLHRVEAEFAENFFVDCGMVDENSPVFFAIDWQRVWDHSLSYDFDCILDNHFFRNH